MKRTSREFADSIMRDGEFLEIYENTLIVSAFGNIYKIDNAYSKRPKITQLKEVQNDNRAIQR